jgi:hypothetical protein
MFLGVLKCQQSVLDPTIATIGKCKPYRVYRLHSPRGSNWGSLGLDTLFSAWGEIATRMTAATLMPPLPDTLLRVSLISMCLLLIVCCRIVLRHMVTRGVAAMWAQVSVVSKQHKLTTLARPDACHHPLIYHLCMVAERLV